MIQQLKKQYKPFSMAFSGGRVEFLWSILDEIVKEKIPGDVVECGVYKGGNGMIMAQALRRFNSKRRIWLYDTFTGMPKPTKEDVFHNGKKAKDIWHRGWCEGSLDEVIENMKQVGYPYYELIEGMVEDTIPARVPKQIALLRLDTDFYQSTRHELEHLYPLLTEGGYLIIDDYHSWRGSRQACDELLPTKNFLRIGTSNAAWCRK